MADFISPAYAQLTAFVSSIPGLLPAEASAFTACWKPVPALRRTDFLMQAGQVEYTLYFVHKGLLRVYYPTESEEICVGFAYDQTLICSFPSFINQQPSAYAIQALRRTELLGIHRTDFMRFVDENAAFTRFWRTELERNLLGRIEREIDLLLPDPAQRYQRLRTRSPHILQYVPRKYIASYLRMTPETLSRLR
ncbi:Crp/Fnr family transcriptional regulator [Hymenobacter perfusus]|uniref:Crp/Fnr family transcriptional regulator n=1 Tax=Hymenobacter perfusus TaxID=1236770 RepID=UPI00147739CB|nr:Crp/Fnr family transcriptional regulator [Hymenobacter perfusus]